MSEVETYIADANADRATDELVAIEQNDREFAIPLDCWKDFLKVIKKLNNKAKRLGCEPVTYDFLGQKEVTRTFYFTVETEHGKEERSRRCKVQANVIYLHGENPKLEGFNFIARVEYLSDGVSTLFHTVPGNNVKIDERFRGLGLHVCEHCNKVRRRNDVFIVEEIATGKQTQVGRQCLADFTGITDPRRLVGATSRLSIFNDLRDASGGWWGRYHDNTIDTLEVLTLTSAAIGLYGWVPKSAANFGNVATSANVLAAINAPDTVLSRAEREVAVAVIDEAKKELHVERAKTVWTWVRETLAQKPLASDYETNLVTLVKGELCERRHLGLVCSAVAAWQRAMNKAVEYAERKAKLANSQHIEAKIGDRVRGVIAKVHFVKCLEPGMWGPKTLVKFLTEDGNMLVWFASGDREYTIGETLKITGTVKQFKEYNGIKETQLSRVITDDVK